MKPAKSSPESVSDHEALRNPFRHAGIGKLFQFAGVSICIIGLASIFGAGQKDALDLMLYGLAAVAGGYYTWLRGTRISSVSAEELLDSDSRAPIVFIRSFGDEEQSFRLKSFFAMIGRYFVDSGFQQRYFQAGTSFWRPMLQQQFKWLFNQIGPYVAIGRPGEKIPATGAARLYVSDNDWKKVVGDFFGKARLIIVHPGKTTGLRWEINEIIRLGMPEKILFILPAREDNYMAFSAWVNKELPERLPETMPSARFIAFDAEWKPYPLGGYKMLLDTLLPYLNRNGVSKKDFNLLYRFVFNSGLGALVVSAVVILLLFVLGAVLIA